MPGPGARRSKRTRVTPSRFKNGVKDKVLDSVLGVGTPGKVERGRSRTRRDAGTTAREDELMSHINREVEQMANIVNLSEIYPTLLTISKSYITFCNVSVIKNQLSEGSLGLASEAVDHEEGRERERVRVWVLEAFAPIAHYLIQYSKS